MNTIRYLLLIIMIGQLVPAVGQDAFTEEITDLPKDSVAIPGDSVVKSKNIFKKVINYFDESNVDKTTYKKIDFSVIGGPYFSTATKLGLGIVASGLYRINKKDLSISPSNVSFMGDVTTTGFYLLGIRGNNLWTGAKHRIDYVTYFFSFPTSYWGIGYDRAISPDCATYDRKQFQAKVDYMYMLFKQFYVGVNVSYNYIYGANFQFKEGRKYEDYWGNEDSRQSNIGAGLFVQYDSRDFIVNAYKGIYFKADQRFFPSFLGNQSSFTRTEITFNWYKQLWKGAILAYDIHAMFNYGNPPWTLLSLMGGSNRMRGYYEGRFRDRNMIETQIELRQKVWRRNGLVVWVGGANLFPSFNDFKWSQTLPNFGIGYRWEFKNRVNVRLDYGFGLSGMSGFMLGINEAF